MAELAFTSCFPLGMHKKAATPQTNGKKLTPQFKQRQLSAKRNPRFLNKNEGSFGISKKIWDLENRKKYARSSGRSGFSGLLCNRRCE